MTIERPGPPQSVPILTEVISWPDEPSTAQGERRPTVDPAAGGVAGPHDADAGGQLTRPPAVDETAPMSSAGPPPDVPPSQAPAGETSSREPVPTGGALDEHALARRVLLELQGRLDGVLEYRVREVLTPILDRAADALVRDARRELSRSLAELVTRAVADELRRQRAG
jgi:hypothetical protein